jgi:hypothetical protein
VVPTPDGHHSDYDPACDAPHVASQATLPPRLGAPHAAPTPLPRKRRLTVAQRATVRQSSPDVRDDPQGRNGDNESSGLSGAIMPARHYRSAGAWSLWVARACGGRARARRGRVRRRWSARQWCCAGRSPGGQWLRVIWRVWILPSGLRRRGAHGSATSAARWAHSRRRDVPGLDRPHRRALPRPAPWTRSGICGIAAGPIGLHAVRVSAPANR